MSKMLTAVALTLLASGCITTASWAQSAGTSAARPQASATPASQTGAHRGEGSRKKADTSMNTGADAGQTPTGPNTSTIGADQTSDLSGSTGPSTLAAPIAAPQTSAPPGGAASGGDTSNSAGGPH